VLPLHFCSRLTCPGPTSRVHGKPDVPAAIAAASQSTGILLDIRADSVGWLSLIVGLVPSHPGCGHAPGAFERRGVAMLASISLLVQVV
jgi:hypothetical protein